MAEHGTPQWIFTACEGCVERTDKNLFDCVYWWIVVVNIVQDESVFKYQNILLPCTGQSSLFKITYDGSYILCLRKPKEKKRKKKEKQNKTKNMRSESVGTSLVYTTAGAITLELLYCSHGKNNSSRVSFVLPVIPNMMWFMSRFFPVK